jgi:hypothetical protein
MSNVLSERLGSRRLPNCKSKGDDGIVVELSERTHRSNLRSQPDGRSHAVRSLACLSIRRATALQ